MSSFDPETQDSTSKSEGKPDACGLASAYFREIAEKGDDCSDTTSFFALFVIKTVGEWECLTSASGDASALETGREEVTEADPSLNDPWMGRDKSLQWATAHVESGVAIGTVDGMVVSGALVQLAHALNLFLFPRGEGDCDDTRMIGHPEQAKPVWEKLKAELTFGEWRDEQLDLARTLVGLARAVAKHSLVLSAWEGVEVEDIAFLLGDRAPGTLRNHLSGWRRHRAERMIRLATFLALSFMALRDSVLRWEKLWKNMWNRLVVENILQQPH
ncbi:unnamed protein product [Cladocopium goreaui]|uniref:Uncharacterized protein n=1 Tax=Cladocopium goreaui TaxID=2562237 RepID=A0A9P1BU85_9DINO|nr:unnamed protein product [Cladocopium goreaui]